MCFITIQKPRDEHRKQNTWLGVGLKSRAFIRDGLHLAIEEKYKSLENGIN